MSTSSNKNRKFDTHNSHGFSNRELAKLCHKNEDCKNLSSCTHFCNLGITFRREHVKKHDLCFKCLESHVQKTEKGQVALLRVELTSKDRKLETYAYLGKGCCQKVILESTVQILILYPNGFASRLVGGYHIRRVITCAQNVSQISFCQNSFGRHYCSSITQHVQT